MDLSLEECVLNSVNRVHRKGEQLKVLGGLRNDPLNGGQVLIFCCNGFWDVILCIPSPLQKMPFWELTGPLLNYGSKGAS